MKDKRNSGRRFSFQIDREKLLSFSGMSVSARLRWLEEANKFLFSVRNKKLKKRWKTFRETAF